jgi:hypothetical protein
MKKIIVFAAMLFIAGSASAQTQTTTDTLTTSSSADTVHATSPDKYFVAVDGTFAAAITATRISGTVNANAILQHTVDGTNWTNLECPCTYGATTTTQDTVALSNVATAQHVIWNCSGVKTNKVRVRVIAPSSTQAVQVKGYYIKK